MNKVLVILTIDLENLPSNFQEILQQERAVVADVLVVVDRRPAHIHAHARGIERRESPLLARQGIVEPELHRMRPIGLAGRASEDLD